MCISHSLFFFYFFLWLLFTVYMNLWNTMKMGWYSGIQMNLQNNWRCFSWDFPRWKANSMSSGKTFVHPGSWAGMRVGTRPFFLYLTRLNDFWGEYGVKKAIMCAPPGLSSMVNKHLVLFTTVILNHFNWSDKPLPLQLELFVWVIIVQKVQLRFSSRFLPGVMAIPISQCYTRGKLSIPLLYTAMLMKALERFCLPVINIQLNSSCRGLLQLKEYFLNYLSLVFSQLLQEEEVNVFLHFLKVTSKTTSRNGSQKRRKIIHSVLLQD